MYEVFNGYLMYVFHKVFWLLKGKWGGGGILSLSRALSDCLCTPPCAPVITIIREFTFHP